mmetsp:Transcript_120358/g.300234  ORF Transcript_120358/g.300234 Transcript_120358/m.300234 type:complete len:529 (-) Transcript_120358:15-1601(-)
MAAPDKRGARILAGVAEDIDRFLDPEVLTTTAREGGALGTSASAALAPSRAEAVGVEASSVAETHGLRSEALRLKGEAASLQVELENAREVDGAQCLEAFQQAATAAVTEARLVASADSSCVGGADSVIERRVQDDAVTPLDSSEAWVGLQAEVCTLRQRQTELQQELGWSAQRERKAQAELTRAQSETAFAQARVEELQLDLRRARDEAAAQHAGSSVLREAIDRGSSDAVDVSGENAAEVQALTSQLDAAQRQATNFKAIAQARQKAAEEKDRELEVVRAENLRLVEAAAKVAKLERVNAELLGANRELEHELERLAAELEERDAQAEDFDRGTTKILHLVRGPDGQLATGGSTARVAATLCGATTEQQQTLAALRAENAALREELQRGPAPTRAAAAAGDLERRQAERQLDRFKKATRKYVQDFREGIHGLLGWKVEMKGEGSMMRWHLSSRYFRPGQELVFQLRPSSAPGGGRSAGEFDLLGTEWAEQLQEDRQAMAYLEVYGSIPGFLASVTTDLLSQGSLLH